MFQTINAQQQPFIQSGYGALNKLNTLLGIGGRRAPPALPAPTGEMPLGGNATLMPRTGYAPTPAGGMDQRIPTPIRQGPSAQGFPDLRLRQMLQLRAMQGDPQAIAQLQSSG